MFVGVDSSYQIRTNMNVRRGGISIHSKLKGKLFFLVCASKKAFNKFDVMTNVQRGP